VTVSVLLGLLVASFATTDRGSPLRSFAVFVVLTAGPICTIIAIVMGVIAVYDGGASRKCAIASFGLSLVNGAAVLVLVGLAD
jgi:hypothetical protein